MKRLRLSRNCASLMSPLYGRIVSKCLKMGRFAIEAAICTEGCEAGVGRAAVGGLAATAAEDME